MVPVDERGGGHTGSWPAGTVTLAKGDLTLPGRCVIVGRAIAEKRPRECGDAAANLRDSVEFCAPGSAGWIPYAERQAARLEDGHWGSDAR